MPKPRVVWKRKLSLEDKAPFDVGIEFTEVEEDNKTTPSLNFCATLYITYRRRDNDEKIVYGYGCVCVLTSRFIVFYADALLSKYPDPEEVIKHPLGTESIKIGMAKETGRSHLGKPDEIGGRG